MVACSGHILESTKGNEIKLGTYIDELSLFNYFHKRLFSLSCLGVQIVFDYKFCLYRQQAFGEHPHFQRIPCSIQFTQPALLNMLNTCY